MNDNNAQAVLRSLIIYIAAVVLAICVGFLLAAESEVSQGNSSFWVWNVFALFKYHPIAWSLLFLILSMPVLLRWHYFLLIFCWNLTVTLFFLPGSPPIWMLMVALSLGISILQRTIHSGSRFISTPQITWSLIFLTVVVLFTARMTGGIGLKALGNEVMGGKNYFLLLGGILGYFALTAKRIPPERARLYVAVFFLCGFSSAISDLVGVLPSSLDFIFLLFPPSGYMINNGQGAISEYTRFQGVATMSMYAFILMLAFYGIRGIFMSGKLWRTFAFVASAILMGFGGFRSLIILCGLMFVILFFMEGLHRTKLFPIFILVGLFAAALVIPLADKLPFSIQRSLAFLPLKIDPIAREDAEASSEWRFNMWKEVLPTVPQYLLLGKGYALSRSDMEAVENYGFHYLSDAEGTTGIVGNYHSGPLSVVIPFGIWGVIAILWFWIASLRALYCNYRYGDPSLRIINLFLYVDFIAQVISFIAVFGGLYGQMIMFTGIVGLSVSLNGGISSPARKPVPDKSPSAPVPFRPPLRPRPGFAPARIETQTSHR